MTLLVAGLAGCEEDYSDPQIKESVIAKHWVAVRHRKAFLEDKENWEVDPQSGLLVTTPPDISVHLAALVLGGELNHYDLVLPTVPGPSPGTRRLCEAFWDSRDDVWEMHWSGRHVGWQPAGEQPLRIQLWFEDSALDAVKQLVRDLEALPKAPATQPGGPPHWRWPEQL
ncbi:MAG: hypothetical protein AAGA57_04775 [Planctomycetota bacterium]